MSRAAPRKPPVGRKRARSAADDGLPGAVRTARAVLEEDRWRRPDTVLLKTEEEAGLAVLLRDGTNRLDRDIPEEEIKALPRTGEWWRVYECLVRHNQRLVLISTIRHRLHLCLCLFDSRPYPDAPRRSPAERT